MSAQLGIGRSGSGLTQAKSRSSKRGRQLAVNVRAQDKKADEPIGTQLLKVFGSGTLSLKPNKEGGTAFLQSLTGTLTRARSASPAPDVKTVFVAGATGRTGARVVRELVKAGFKVRAGARDVDAAKQALAVAETYGLISAAESKQVSVVAVDYSKSESIKAAIGGARKVVCALGAAESEALNFSNPKKVDGEFTTALINQAAAAGVEQFVLVSSLGTGKIGFPASVLNLFGGILYWKREAEKALEGSGMTYTIVRPGGMERPTDSYKKTHNVVLSPKDTTFGGNVSRLQVAELITTAVINPELAENKIVEVTAETTAPRQTYQELLASINPDVTREQQVAARAASEEARSELQEAQEKADKAKAALAAADARVKELADRLKQAKGQESEVKAKVAPILKDGASAEKALEAAKAAAEKAALQEAASKAVFEAAKKAAAQGQLLDKKALKAVADQVLNPPPAPKAQPAAGAAGAAKPLFSFLPTPAAPAQEASPAPAAKTASSRSVSPAPAARSPTPAPPPSKSASPSFNFGSLFGIPDAVQVDSGAAAAAPQVASKEATPAPKAAPAPAKEASPAPTPAPKPTVAAKPATPSPPPREEPQPLFAGFGGFFAGLGSPINTDEVKKVEVPPKAEPAVVAAKATAPPAPAAAPAPPPAPKPVVAKVTPAAPAKPATPVEDPREVERRALAALADERRQRALDEAKARLAKEAEAVAAAKAAAAKAAQQKAPSPEPVEPAPAPVKAAPVKATAPAPAPAKAVAPVAPAGADVAAEKAKVQAWIAAWEAKQAAAAKPAAAAAAAPAAPAASNGVVAANGAVSAEDAARAKAKAEAQAWIAAWEAKQKVAIKQ